MKSKIFNLGTMNKQTELKILEPENIEEFKELLSIFETAFDMESLRRPSAAHLQKLLNRDDFLAVVAKVEGKLVGGLTVYLLEQYFYERPLAYIYDLAVLPEHRRMGLGRSLVEFTKKQCKDRGIAEVFVETERNDQQAMDFYRSTSPQEELAVTHFSYHL